jgi:hypothetical protein
MMYDEVNVPITLSSSKLIYNMYIHIQTIRDACETMSSCIGKETFFLTDPLIATKMALKVGRLLAFDS